MKSYIVVITKKGKAVRFNAKELVKSHPGGEGVNVVKLTPGDQVVSAFAVNGE